MEYNFNFSKRELIAILNVANGMADIDGQTDSIETNVIYTQMIRLGLNYDSLLDLTAEAILNMEPSEAMDIIARMNSMQKEYVQALLIIIMSSDGEVHDKEWTMLNVITKRCGLPTINVEDISKTVIAFRRR